MNLIKTVKVVVLAMMVASVADALPQRYYEYINCVSAKPSTFLHTVKVTKDIVTANYVVEHSDHCLVCAGPAVTKDLLQPKEPTKYLVKKPEETNYTITFSDEKMNLKMARPAVQATVDGELPNTTVVDGIFDAGRGAQPVEMKCSYKLFMKK